MSKKTSCNIKTIAFSLPCSGDSVRIRPISDVHIGDPHCDLAAFRQMIGEIAADKDCYTVLVGDLCNTAIASGKSDVYGEQRKPGEQARDAAELLKPISDRILAVVPGNHEERVYKQTGVDMSELISDLLGVHSVYRGTSALLFLSVGDGHGTAHGRQNIYSVYLNHGHGGGGRRAGSKVNALQDLGYAVDADIILAGHTHLPATFRTSRIRCSNHSKTASVAEQVFVNTASLLDYPGSYGDRGGYQPGSKRYPVIALGAHARDISVTL